MRQIRSSITGNKLSDEFYMILSSKYPLFLLVKKVKSKYQIDLSQNLWFPFELSSYFVLNCNAQSHQERLDLLSKRLFLSLVMGYVFYKNDIVRTTDKFVKKDIEILNNNKNPFLIEGRPFVFTTKNKTEYNDKVNRIYGERCRCIYGFNEKSLFKESTTYMKSVIFFCEKSIFDKLTEDFDSLFPDEWKEDNLSLIQHGLISNEINSRQELETEILNSNLFENIVKSITSLEETKISFPHPIFSLYEKKGRFFISKLKDLGIRLNKNARTVNYMKDRIESLNELSSLI